MKDENSFKQKQVIFFKLIFSVNFHCYESYTTYKFVFLLCKYTTARQVNTNA